MYVNPGPATIVTPNTTAAYGAAGAIPIVSVSDASGNVVGLSGISLGNFSAGPVAPVTDVVLADSGVVGLPNGQYWGKVTFVTVAGETDYVTSIGASVTVASKKINWSSIPVSTDPTVIGRRLYRTIAGADSVTDPREYFLTGTLNDNITTTFVDNLADVGLGVSIPSVNTAVPFIVRNGLRFGNFVGNSYGLGQGALALGTGYASVAIGLNSQPVNTSGKRNVGVGAFTLAANTTGSRNTAIGTHALNSNITNSDRTGVGYGVLFNSILSATFPSTGVGAYALYNENSSTGGNTCIGYQAGKGFTTGNQNVVIGLNAMTANTGGSNNVAAGVSVMGNANSGSFNTGIGHSALSALTTASSVVAVGAYAGNYATSASGEFFLNNQDRTNYAGDQTASLMYGKFNATVASQTLAINAVVFPLQVATAPTYVKGGIYFDTALNKLRVGGATAWETITSA